jgi:hypothetical protein
MLDRNFYLPKYPEATQLIPKTFQQSNKQGSDLLICIRVVDVEGLHAFCRSFMLSVSRPGIFKKNKNLAFGRARMMKF